MEEGFLAIIDQWNMVGRMLGSLLIIVALILSGNYYRKLVSLNQPKDRYDFMVRKEIEILWKSSLLLIIGIAVLSNAFLHEIGSLWLAFRLFISVALSFMVLIIVRNFLKFYYPFRMEKRLKKLRYQPRISPESGKPMKLLSEEEEDVYLDEGMQAEEDVFSVDYDVWIDEGTGYTQIEKYAGNLHALPCPECGYQTYKVIKEDVVRKPTSSEPGALVKHYQCHYCGFQESKPFTIAVLNH